MNYADRTNEFKLIEKFINKDVQVVIIHSKKAVGLSSFLKFKFSDYKKYYLDLQPKSSICLVENLVSQFDKTERKRLQQIANEKYGKYESGLLASLFGILPYIGNFAESRINGKKATDVCTINYTAWITKILPTFLTEMAKDKKIGIFIDDAQYLTSYDYDFILDLTQIHNIYFVFAITDASPDFYKLKSELLYKQVTMKDYNFPDPNTELVIEWSKLIGKEINHEQAKVILSECDNNVYKVRNSLLHTELRSYEINVVDIAIICICSIIPFDINKQTLYSILLFSKDLVIDSNIYDLSINKLKHNRIIETDGARLHISSTSHPLVKKIHDNRVNILYYRQIVFYYYSQKTNLNLNELTLVYELSQEYDLLHFEHWLYKVLIMRLSLGLNIPHNLLNQLELTDNIKLKIVAYTYTRDYSKALSETKKLIKKETLNDSFYKLYAILLNRCGFHDKAEECLLECLKIEKNNIVAAFLISNYIHQEKIKEAEIFYKNYLKYVDFNRDSGYFYRNAAAIYWEQLDIFEKALEIFDYENDKFGYYTTLCNYAMRETMLRHFEKAEKMFLEAETNLPRFGNDNLHILYNNLGLYYVLTNNIASARKYFNLALSFSKTSMPSIFIQINQACMELKLGNNELAKKIIDSLEEDVKKTKVNRVKQKYYLNKVLIYYANNQDFCHLIKLANRNPDRYNSKYTSDRLCWYKAKKANRIVYKSSYWDYCFYPCYLEYWYVNPLKLFPIGIRDDILTEHT